MPLQRSSKHSETYSQRGLIELISILESDSLRELRISDNVTIRRLIHLYPSTLHSKKPNLIWKIMEYYWDSNYRKSILEKLISFEKFLLALGKREHFVHQFEVMLLGLNILEVIKEKRGRPDIFKFEEWKDIFLTWTVTAMGHDFGYPYQVSSEILSELSLLYKELNMDNLSDHISIAQKTPALTKEYKLLYFHENKLSHFKSMFDIKAFLNQSLTKSLAGDINIDELEAQLLKGEKPDHGYISAIMLCRSVLEEYNSQTVDDNLIDFKNSKDCKKLIWSSSAIACHNFSYSNKKHISFQKNPYAYILYILDSIHDWDRTIFENEEWPDYHLRDFQRSDIGLTLDIQLIDDTWPPEMINNVLESLNSKRIEFENLENGPSPSYSFSLVINYSFNTDKINWSDPITIAL